MMPRSKARRFCSLIFFFALSCAPEGELQRTIHPPHKKYTDRSVIAAPAVPETVAPDPALTATHKGLPSACAIESGAQTCIRCASDAWTVHRCYAAPRTLDTKSECQYTPEHVKCLASRPPFALNLEWKASDEKFLRENYLIWRDSVHQIWDDKLSGEEKLENDRILQSLDTLTLALSSQPAPTERDKDAFLKALALPQDKDQGKAGQLIAKLQTLRLAGKISLTSVLDSMGSFYEETHGASDRWNELRTMSLEGLED